MAGHAAPPWASRISHLLAGTKVTVRCGTGGMAPRWYSLSAGKDISATTSTTRAAPGAAARAPRLLLEDPPEGAVHLAPHRQAEGGEQGLGGQRPHPLQRLVDARPLGLGPAGPLDR